LKTLKFQHASQNSSFNKRQKIFNDGHKKELLEELDCPDTDWMRNCFNKHCEMMSTGRDYVTNSGLTPLCILSCHLYIRRFSPTFFDGSDEEKSDSEDE
jgi:hypothetical protein